MAENAVGAHAALALAVFAALCIGGVDFVYRSAGGERAPAGRMLVQSLAFPALVAPLALGAGAVASLAGAGPARVQRRRCAPTLAPLP